MAVGLPFRDSVVAALPRRYTPRQLKEYATNKYKTAVVVLLFLLHNKISKVSVWTGAT